MSERYFVAQPLDSSRPVLAEDEVRHLVSVMRAQAGDQVVLFDGSGDEWLARVVRMKKNDVELELIERRAIDRELPFSLTLAVALPKGDRQKWLVEKATELGVTRLLPLVTERGVAQPVESALLRLRRSVIEASKQCGRNRLMEIAQPQCAQEYWTGSDLAHLRLVADPGGEPLARVATSPSCPMQIAIGPEGGFTAAELIAARAAGWRAITLGPRILRVETAAIALAAWAGLAASHDVLD